jgi:hypothetical protein
VGAIAHCGLIDATIATWDIEALLASGLSPFDLLPIVIAPG